MTRLEQLWQDVRYGCRVLVKAPAFSLVAILSLAVGIGANCAIFSFADALLLRPLPVPRAGELLSLGSTLTIEAIGASGLATSYPDYVDIRDRNRSFTGITAYNLVTAGFVGRPGAAPVLKMGMVASGNLFDVMEVRPVLGRGFRLEEDRVPGRDAVVVLSHVIWEQQFGSDPGVLGRRVDLNGRAFTVIGVAPASFPGPVQYVRADFFVPLMMSSSFLTDPKSASLQARDARDLTLQGRLGPGVSQAAAQAELETIGAALALTYPDTNKNRRWAVQTQLQARLAQSPPDAMLVAMLATLALAVLLVACANVAGLLTSRAPVRAREIALRLAVGAGRARVVRQLVTESLLIALAGALAGLGVGYAGIVLFRRVELPTDLPVLLSFRMDHRALLFSLAVAVASALLFGLSPAIRATRSDLAAVIKSTDAPTPGRRRQWGRSMLVGGQVAISVVLLAVALFIYRGFSGQLAAGPGYRTDHLLMMSFDTSLLRYPDAQAAQFFRDVADRAREVPGVVRVSLASAVPMATNGIGLETVVPEGFHFAAGKENAIILSSWVDEHYFATMGLTLIGGRDFRADDTADSPRVVIVNEQFARHYWPNQDPIGKRIRLVDRDNAWAQVVGLARNSKYLFIAEPPSEFLYCVYRQRPVREMVLLAQSSGDPAGLAAPLREVARRLDPNLPVYNVRTMEELYRMRATTIFSVLTTIIGAMGLMGLGLAIVGLYGLVAYAASRRTREIGIRMAIGADQPTVLRMVLRHGLVLALAGLVIGLAASLGAGRLLDAAFPSVSEGLDYGALGMVVPTVLLVTVLATYVPARRASRIDPTQALRHE